MNINRRFLFIFVIVLLLMTLLFTVGVVAGGVFTQRNIDALFVEDYIPDGTTSPMQDGTVTFRALWTNPGGQQQDQTFNNVKLSVVWNAADPLLREHFAQKIIIDLKAVQFGFKTIEEVLES